MRNPFSIVEVHVPVSPDEVEMARRWCEKTGKKPNRKNIAAMLRSWCGEGLRDFGTDPNEKAETHEGHGFLG